MKIIEQYAKVNYEEPLRALLSVSIDGENIARGSMITKNEVSTFAAIMSNGRESSTYQLALAKNDTIVKTIGTFTSASLTASVDFSQLDYDSYDVVLVEDGEIIQTWAEFVWQAPVSLTSVSINNESISQGESRFLLDISTAEAIISSPLPDKTYRLCLAQNGTIVKNLGAFNGTTMSAAVSMVGEDYGIYQIVLAEDNDIIITWASITYAAPASLLQVSMNNEAINSGATAVLAEINSVSASMYSPEPGVVYALALAQNNAVVKTLGTFNGTTLSATPDMNGVSYGNYAIVLTADGVIKSTWANLRYELNVGEIYLMGNTSFKTIGTNLLDVAVQNQGYSVPLTSLVAQLTQNGQPVSNDPYLRATADLATMKVTLEVLSIPTADRSYGLLVTATDANNDTYTASATPEILAIPVTSFAINGDASVSEAGTKNYTIGNILPADNNLGIQSLAVSVSTPSTGSVSAAAVGTTGATLTIATMPDTTESVVLTIAATIADGSVVTETKSVELQVGPALEFVDLGLPSGLLWANMNLGANAPEEDGEYFQWGDTIGHAAGSGYDFSQANYDAKGLNNINADLTLAQDAANVALGGTCRMPTKTEFQELYDNTDNEWTTINGVAGRKFMKKTDHNVYIFFPAAGCYIGTSLNGRGSGGYYWSASWVSASHAYNLFFGSSGVNPQNYNDRYCGFSVRAVQ